MKKLNNVRQMFCVFIMFTYILVMKQQSQETAVNKVYTGKVYTVNVVIKATLTEPGEELCS